MSEPDDLALDRAVVQLLASDAVWDDDDFDDLDTAPSADAIVAAIRAERTAVARPHPARRWLGPIVAGVAAAALTIVAYGLIASDDAPQTADPPADVTVAMAATELAPEATATAQVTARPLGTVIRLDTAGLPPAAPGTYYEAWMRTDADRVVSAGTFHMRGGDGLVYLWSGVNADDYPMLTVSIQDEGDVAPSGRVVLQARLDEP